ncbi:MAG: NAD(P)-dependent oxidoreductase [Phycisphaerales bacterium JB039]
MALKVLIADKFETSGIEGLKALGCEVQLSPELGPDTLPAAIAAFEPDILIVRSTKVPAPVIEGAESLKAIIRAGAGFDNIDIDAAAARGIGVCNCPGMNAVAVAEVAFAHLLCADRRLPEQLSDLRAGKWRKKEYAKARGIKGLTLGVIGVGAIGRAIVQRAKAFEMDVIGWDVIMTAARAAELGIRNGGSTRADLLKMLPKCDAVSLHIAANAETKNMCNAEFFAAMKPGAYFINTSRGTVVDEQALKAAILDKGVRAGLDVYQNQPPTPEMAWTTELASLPGVTCTHHCGASTDQAQQAVADETVRIVKVFSETGKLEHLVNEPQAAGAAG